MPATISDNARKVLDARYIDPEHDKNVQGMFKRVSLGNPDYYKLLSELYFLPNSPTMFNMGLPTGGTSSACFVFDIDDTLLGEWPLGGLNSPFANSIMGTMFKAACVAKAGGGVGYYGGNIRPKGSPVKSTHKKACGPVAVLRFLHQLRELITQGGKRDLAQMFVLPCWHKDILEFIHCKDLDPKSLESFNISVSWTDEWLKRIDWGYFGAYSNNPEQTENNIWYEQCCSAWRTGCPGMFFWTTVNRYNATPHLGDINAPNPCGETPNLSDEPCNLGSIALPRMMIHPDSIGMHSIIHWERLKETVRTSVRFLDDILDNNVFPHPDITKMALSTRKLGLGVMGWADMLALMHIPYDSGTAVDLGREVMKVINDTALDESVQLAKKKGAYPAYKSSPEGRADDHGRIVPFCRNSTRTSIAPTGTIALIADVYSGIEPYYTLGDGERTTFEGIKLYEGIPQWIAKRLGSHVPKTAKEINYTWHIKHQAAFQKHTNLGVSKCVVGNTLVLTGEGWKEIHDLHTERGTDKFRPMKIVIHGESDLTYTGQFYSGGIKDTIRVKTKQGSEIEGTRNHRIRVERNGEVVWRRLDELNENDLVIIKTGQKVYANQELVTPEMACLLGHAIADGSIQDNWLTMSHKDPEVTCERRKLLAIREVRNLVESSRNTRCTKRIPLIKTDARNGVVSVQQNSRALVRWLEQTVGMKRRAANKCVPPAIMLSSWRVQKAFLRGLFTDCGVANRPNPNLAFSTASRKMARQVRAMLMNAGMYTTLHTHVVNGKSYFKLQFTSRHALKFAKIVGFVESSRTEQFNNWKKHKSLSNNPNGGIPAPRKNYRVEKVENTKPGRSVVFDVSVPDGKHAFITEGIVSHNTINMPNSATVKDISNAYKMMWETECKGGTIFREGCRDEQVLREKPKTSVYMTGFDPAKSNVLDTVKADEPESPDYVKITEELKNYQNKIQRYLTVPPAPITNRRKPSKTRGAFVHQFSIAQTKGYLTVGMFDDGKPAEIFLTVSRAGSTLDGMLDTWAKMVSNALQYGMPLADIVRMHEGTRFEPSGLTSDPEIKTCSSIPDYVVRWLANKFESKQTTTIESLPKPSEVVEQAQVEFDSNIPVLKIDKIKGSGVMCPDCGTETIYESGCLRCIRAGCGWNRC